MSKSELVRVPFGDNQADKATLLLAAAESKGLDASVVTVDTQGTEMAFMVPREVADAGLSGADAKSVEDHPDPFEPRSGETVSMYPSAEAEAEIAQAQEESEPAAKKTAAKKTAAKRPARKRAAKKSTAKKTAAKKTTKASE